MKSPTTISGGCIAALVLCTLIAYGEALPRLFNGTASEFLIPTGEKPDKTDEKVLTVGSYGFVECSSFGHEGSQSFPDRTDDSAGHRARIGINLTTIGRTSIDEVSYTDYAPPTMAFLKTPRTCSDCVCGVGRKTRIVGGSLSNIAEYPWMVGMVKQGLFHCGGSLITRNHVLTAAHCLDGYERKHFELHMGDQDITKRSSSLYRRRIKSWTIHESFNPYNLNNDIAIVELDRPVPLDGVVRTACLPENRAIDYTGALAMAVGWGRIKEGSEVSKLLRNVRLPVLSEEECDESGYPKTRRTENMFCAGYLEGRFDSCSGDSGGPLLVQGPLGHMEVIGITSFGRGCARPRYPGVYTKLTNYLGWLEDKLGGDCVCPPPTRV